MCWTLNVLPIASPIVTVSVVYKFPLLFHDAKYDGPDMFHIIVPLIVTMSMCINVHCSSVMPNMLF